MASKRIYSLDSATDLTDKFLAVDKSGNTEAEKIGAEGVDFYKKVEVSSAELLDIHDTPIELISAPGDGKLLIITNFLLYLNYSSIVYTGDVSLSLSHSDPTNAIAYINLDFSASAISFQQTTIENTPSGVINKAFTASTETSNPLSGNSSITIHLWYKIVTL